MAEPDLSALEQKYNLPPGILDATRHVESRNNPNATSPKGAAGTFQLMPPTARALGVNARDPVRAADGAARLIRQNLDATSGDIDEAMRMYQGGSNRKIWGAQNAAYPGLILAALQRGNHSPQQAPPSDPFGDIMGSNKPANAPPNAPQSADPFAALMQSDKALSHDSAAPHPDVQANPVQGRQDGGNNAGGGPAGGADRSAGGSRGGRGEIPAAVPGGRTYPSIIGMGGGFDSTSGDPAQDLMTAHTTADAFNGMAQGGLNAVRNIAHYGMMGVGGGGMNAITDPRVNALIDPAIAFLKRHSYDANGMGSSIGRIMGDVGATLPVSELKLVKPAAEGAGALARILRGAANFSAQGGVAGAEIGEPGHDLQNIALGSLVGGGAGLIGEGVVAPALSWAIRKFMPGATEKAGATAALQIMPQEVQDGISQMLRNRSTKAAIDQAFPEWSGARGISDPAALDRWVKYYRSGGKPTEEFVDRGPQKIASANPGGAPQPLSGPQIAAAVKSQGAAGSKRGLEGINTLPASAQEKVNTLVRQGVPVDQAVNSASIDYIPGAKGTLGKETRQFTLQQRESAAGKMATPEGMALAQRTAEDNAALHAAAIKTIDSFGGVPAEGVAASSAAKRLSSDKGVMQTETKAAYDAFEKADPGALIKPNSLYTLLNSDAARAEAPGTPAAAVLATARNTIDLAQAAHGSKLEPLGMSPLSLMNLIKATNRKFGADGGANHWVGEVVKAASNDLDQIGELGPLGAAARAAHRKMMETYGDPVGLAKLIKTDKRGNMVNQDNWRSAEGTLVGTNSDQAFTQVVSRLKELKAWPEIAKLKADMVYRAYNKATVGNADQLGNPAFSSAKWFGEFDKMGLDKLKLLFTPDELTHLAAIGRAGRLLNEQIPGTVNNSNSASHIPLTGRLGEAMDALAAGPQRGKLAAALHKAGKTGLHVTAGALHSVPGMGVLAHGAIEAGSMGMERAATDKATRVLQDNLAKAIRASLDPAAARTAANDDAITTLTKSMVAAQRKAFARKVGNLSASTGNAARQGD